MNRTDEILARSGSYFNESMRERPAVANLGGSTLESPAEMQGRKKLNGAFAIELERIAPDPEQPRKTFDSETLEQLAHSLKTKGQLQPIRVRWDAGLDRYVIIVGERRYRAAQLAGLRSLDCIVHSKQLTDDERLEIQLVENCVREDLDPIEQAKAIKNLMEKKGWSQGEVAENIRMSRPAVNVALSLLKLPEDIQGNVAKGRIAPTIARELVRLRNEDDQRQMVARVLANGGVTAAEVAESARQRKGSPNKTKSTSRKLSRTWSDGQRFTMTVKRRESLAQLADRLEEWAKALRSESRGGKNAA